MGRVKTVEEMPLPSDSQATPTADGRPSESKADKFKRLANRRVPKALKALAYVRNLANRQQYEYDADKAERIISLIQAEADLLAQAFRGARVDPTRLVLF